MYPYRESQISVKGLGGSQWAAGGWGEGRCCVDDSQFGVIDCDGDALVFDG